MHNKIDYNFYLNQDAFDTLQEILNIGEIKSIFLKAFSDRYEVMSDSLQQEQLLNSKLQEDQQKLTHEIDDLKRVQNEFSSTDQTTSGNFCRLSKKLSQKRKQNSENATIFLLENYYPLNLF